MNTIAETVAKTFVQSFSSEPQLYFSPGRINLIGEHVDYNDGFVMPAAIDKGIYYAIAENRTNDIHFCAADFDEWFSIAINEIKKTSSWKNYVLSVVNEFLLLDKKIKGFNCVFGGDIPRGSGMSSSAAVEGGLAFALNEIFNIGLNRIELAKLCQRAEHNFPGVKCGIMDQFANMMGKKDEVILLDCKSLGYQYFPLKLDGYKIILINSKVHHSLASGEYNIRRGQCEEGLNLLKEKLNIHSFRDIGSAQNLLPYKNLMSEDVFKRCFYVTEEIERTQKAATLLKQNNLIAFGKLMFETHYGLSKLYDVSCAELDFLVEQAKQNESIIGARLMGGGFGGCTINLVKENDVDNFIDKTSKAYHQQFNIIAEAYIVETSDGTAAIKYN
jgi:galactokinase